MHSIVGTFNGMTQAEVSLFFDNYLNVMFSTTGIPFEAIIFFVVCLILNTWILSRGLSGGIEIAAKIAVPLLIIFGIFLAIQAFLLKAGVNGAIYDGFVGFNFLWTPQLDSLGNPKVWLAAAGQIFFTLSVGMGSIQCYASYLKDRHLPAGELAVLPKCGHNTYEQQPREYVRQIRQFIRRHCG